METSQERELGRTGSVQSVESARPTSEIEEEPPVRVEEDKVYVAVAAELKAGKATLLWAIQSNPSAKTVVVVHVHRPAQMIPMCGKFPASSLSEVQVNAYRQLERNEMNKKLDEYLAVCSRMKVRAEKLVIENDDVTKGLVEVVAQYGIAKLAMGAAADKHYSKKMREPKSKTAVSVKEQADPSCMIWFICKGKLICTRDASAHLSRTGNSTSASQSSISSQSEQLRTRSLPLMENESFSLPQSPLQDHFRHMSFNFAKTPSQNSRLTMPGSSTNTWEEISCSSQMSNHLSASNNDEELGNSRSIPFPSETGSVSLSSVNDSMEDLQFSSPLHELEDLGSDADLFNKLQAALKEAEFLKHEAYEESCRHRKAEMQLILSHQKAKASENLYAKEVRYRKEIEEALNREKLDVEKVKHQLAEALEREKLEVTTLKNQQAGMSEQLQNVIDQKLEMELKLTESVRNSKDFEDKLSATRYLLYTLQEECDILQWERDKAVKEAEELRCKTEQTNSGCNSWPLNTEFSYLNLQQATQNFSNSLKIGEGGFGKVYKGFLHNTTVAIKMLHPKNLQGQAEFHQEVALLSRVRHPNLVTLIGACSDAFALIYEFLPNGSLEECLARINTTPPLTWQVRILIIAEICSALIFLHSNKPYPVLHGDLKPANILLDANLVSKLSDFGICRFLVESNTNATLYCKTHPKGTFAYIDPEFVITGELVPSSDIYAFGIITLRLLTGKPALGIAREVQEAIDKGLLHSIIDPSAGDWPFVQAKQLAHLGLRCSEMSRKNRPDLVAEVWRVVEPMVKAASLPVSSLSFSSFSDENENYRIPPYFICPIFQEIMRDPHIAADGFTYEAEAIQGWIDNGHDTSPMTNLQLPNCELIPNRALRAAIQEWLQQQQS